MLPPSGTFDVAVVPQLETYRDRTSVRLKFLDWRPTSETGAVQAVIPAVIP